MTKSQKNNPQRAASETNAALAMQAPFGAGLSLAGPEDFFAPAWSVRRAACRSGRLWLQSFVLQQAPVRPGR